MSRRDSLPQDTTGSARRTGTGLGGTLGGTQRCGSGQASRAGRQESGAKMRWASTDGTAAVPVYRPWRIEMQGKGGVGFGQQSQALAGPFKGTSQPEARASAAE